MRRLYKVHKYVFLFGGIGAGPEDVSMPAVAKAFGTGSCNGSFRPHTLVA